MAHGKSKYARPFRPLHVNSASVEKMDGTWIVKTVRAGTSIKTYTCPGCQGMIAPGEPHLVAWPATPPIGSSTTIEHRRHWHPDCWRLHH